MRIGYALVTNFLDVEQTAFGADICFAKIFDPVYDCGTNGTGNSVVVRFAHSTNRRHVRFAEEVLGVICNAS